MTKYTIKKYIILLSIVPIILNSNTSIGHVITSGNQFSISANDTQSISKKVDELSNKTQQLESKVNRVSEQYEKIFQEHTMQNKKLNNIEQRQNVLQEQINKAQHNKTDSNNISNTSQNKNNNILSKDDTFVTRQNEKLAEQHAQDIFNQLKNAKTIGERKAIFEKYKDELDFISPVDKVKYISGDLPINQDLNRQLLDNNEKQYNVPVYDNSNLFNDTNSGQSKVQQNTSVNNNNIKQYTPINNQLNTENIIKDFQQANTPQQRQEVLQKYPNISEVIDSDRINQYIENGVPLTQKEMDKVLAQSSANEIINKLKDPNISKEEKQQILQNYPYISQILGNPSNIDQYLNGNIPFPPNFSNDLSNNLLADNIVNKLNAPNTTPQQRHEILQQYPEIIQNINDGNKNIDAQKYKDYINGNIPFPPVLKDSLSQQFIINNESNKNKQQYANSNPNISEVNPNNIHQINQKSNTNHQSTPFDIKSVKDDLSRNKIDGKSLQLKDSNDILLDSPNRLNMNKIYNETNNNSQNLPSINDNGQIVLTPTQSQMQDNRTPESYNKLVKNIASGLNLPDDQNSAIQQPNTNSKSIRLEMLNDSDFPSYSKDDSSIDFIKMTKEQLIDELRKCKNTCKLLQENNGTKMNGNTQQFSVLSPTQLTIPSSNNEEEGLEELLQKQPETEKYQNKDNNNTNRVLQNSDLDLISNNNQSGVLGNNNGVKQHSVDNINVEHEQDDVLKALGRDKETNNNDAVLKNNDVSKIVQPQQEINNNPVQNMVTDSNIREVNQNNNPIQDSNVFNKELDNNTENKLETELNTSNQNNNLNDNETKIEPTNNNLNMISDNNLERENVKNGINNDNTIQNTPPEMQNLEVGKETQKKNGNEDLSDLLNNNEQLQEQNDNLQPFNVEKESNTDINNESMTKIFQNNANEFSNNIDNRSNVDGNTNTSQNNTSNGMMESSTPQIQNEQKIHDSNTSDMQLQKEQENINQDIVLPNINEIQDNINIDSQNNPQIKETNNIHDNSLSQLQNKSEHSDNSNNGNDNINKQNSDVKQENKQHEDSNFYDVLQSENSNNGIDKNNLEQPSNNINEGINQQLTDNISNNSENNNNMLIQNSIEGEHNNNEASNQSQINTETNNKNVSEQNNLPGNMDDSKNQENKTNQMGSYNEENTLQEETNNEIFKKLESIQTFNKSLYNNDVTS